MWDKWARVWDFMLSLGGYDEAYRKDVVKKLCLKNGDSVLDLACGTGLNFKFLEEKVGAEGRIIALDYSKAMLEKARQKVEKNGWRNVRLMEADASNFTLDEKVDAVLCTWAMVSIPDYESAIKCSVDVLKEGGKYSVLDFQPIPGAKGLLLNPILKLFFQATRQDVSRQPWKTMERYLANVCKEDISAGVVWCYIAWGTKRVS